MNSPKAPCLLLLVPDETRGEFIRHLLRAAKPDAEFISATRLDEALRKLEGGSVAAAIADDRRVAEAYSRGQLPYGRVAGFTAAVNLLAASIPWAEGQAP